jgi:hypothetical protein
MQNRFDVMKLFSKSLGLLPKREVEVEIFDWLWKRCSLILNKLQLVFYAANLFNNNPSSLKSTKSGQMFRNSRQGETTETH